MSCISFCFWRCHSVLGVPLGLMFNFIFIQCVPVSVLWALSSRPNPINFIDCYGLRVTGNPNKLNVVYFNFVVYLG
jgi:hypothetical protein